MEGVADEKIDCVVEISYIKTISIIFLDLPLFIDLIDISFIYFFFLSLFFLRIIIGNIIINLFF